MMHDVFVNFRGEEMRKTFVSHLLSSFKTKYITSYIASELFEDLDHEAMEKSLVAIPVISKSYLASDWWVEDLSRVIEREKIGTLSVVPIFFQVNPLDILSHTAGKYASEPLERVRKWLDAQVSRKTSFHSVDWEDDSELVDKITSFVSDILISSPSSYHSTALSPAPSLKLESFLTLDMPWISHSPPSFHFTSLRFFDDSLRLFQDSLLLKLRANLEKRSADSTFCGIFGMEGVGKTFVARALYQDISPRFQHHVYINNVCNSFQRPFSLLQMLPSEDYKGSSFHGSSDEAIKEMIRHRKILLVIDGVDDIKYLKSIMKDASWFGPGSRVIVITRARSLLAECGVKNIYEVECPRYEEALAFFSEFAFKQKKPLPGFEDLSFRAVHVANRLPLALKVLGSFLHDRDKDEWVSTLRRLEASRDNYASEVFRYIGADDYAPRRLIKVDRHIGVDEAISFPSYCLAFN